MATAAVAEGEVAAGNEAAAGEEVAARRRTTRQGMHVAFPPTDAPGYFSCR